MKVHEFLHHHGVVRNPFAEEDAQTDPVFKDRCIANTYHPTWDKVYGDPTEPSTSIVFGEKGSGKTAMQLQIAEHLREYNRDHPEGRLFVIPYDDFNPFLDRFREKMGSRRRRPDRMLMEWQLWDHMDAILSLGVTRLVDQILHAAGDGSGDARWLDAETTGRLDRGQRRDLLLLAACYDRSTSDAFRQRWGKLRRRLRFWTWPARGDLVCGFVVTMSMIALAVGLVVSGWESYLGRFWYVLVLAVIVGWLPWLGHALSAFRLARGIVRRTRVGRRQTGELWKVLMRFSNAQLAGQPLPNKDRTDDRYGLLGKFQGILNTLGFRGIVVLVDRVDEPYLINGSAEMMRALLWPMLDNKFLTHPGLGIKLMLPVELTRFVEREDRDFHQRARLDKQNMIPSLDWTGEALYDVANARLEACAQDGNVPRLRDLLDPAISDPRIIEALRSLRVPRHLFKFLYRLLVAHCNAHTNQEPVWKIPADTFESVLAVYVRDQDALDRGLGAG
jgi:hypothetical protein